MPSKGMKKLRQVEKAGLIVLCVAMLGTLGIGTSTVFEGCGKHEVMGSFVIDGETYEIERPELGEYWTFLTFLRITGQPPVWKFSFGGRLEPQFANYQATEEDLWTFLILDKEAEKAGAPVPAQAVQDWIRRNFRDPESGRYDRDTYARWLASEHISRVWPTARAFEKFLLRYLRVGYYVEMYSPLLWPTKEQVYAQWSVRNRRHDVDYVVQSLASLRREVDAAAIPEAEVETWYAQPKVRRNFRIPTRREFEALYVVLAKMTDERFEELKAKADAADMVKLGPQEGFRHYYANEARLYPISKVVDRLKKEWEEEQAKKKAAGTPEEEGAEKPDGDGEAGDAGEKDAAGKDAADEDGDGAEEPAEDPKPEEPKPEEPKPADPKPEDEPEADDGEGQPAPGTNGPVLDLPTPDAFVDPTASMTPEQKYRTYFQAQVERELFVKKLLERLLKDERIKKQGFEELAAKWGLERYVTERGLDQYEVLANEPVGGQALREALNRIEEGTPYADAVVEIGRDETRGYAIWKVLSVVKEHDPELGEPVEEKLLKNTLPIMARVDYAQLEDVSLAEALALAFPDGNLEKKDSYTVEEVVRQLMRQAKAEEQATEKLQQVMEAVTAGGQTFAAAAGEKGYKVFSLDGIGNETPMAKPEAPAEDEKITDEERKQRLLDGYKWFLLKGRSFATGLPQNLALIGGAEAGSFVPQVLIDRESDAAFAVWVKAHRVPGPEEMPDVEAGKIRTELANQNRKQTLRAFFEWDRIVERYGAEVKGLTDKEKKEEPES